MAPGKLDSYLFNLIWFGPVLVMIALPFLFFNWAPAFLTGMSAFALYNIFQSSGFGDDDDLDDIQNAPAYLKSTLIFLMISLGVPLIGAFILLWIGWI